MPYVQPNSQSVAPDMTLTQIAIGFMQMSEAFVARKVFPAVPVALEAATYFVFDRGDYNRLVMRPRGQSTESAGGGYRMSKAPYFCEVQAIHKDIDDRNRANASIVDLDTGAARYCATQGLLRQEVDWVTRYFRKDAWTFSVDGAASKSSDFNPRDDTKNDIVKFDDRSSEPVETVRDLKTNVQAESGFMPNVMTLGRRPFNILLDHPDIVGRLNRGQT